MEQAGSLTMVALYGVTLAFMQQMEGAKVYAKYFFYNFAVLTTLLTSTWREY